MNALEQSLIETQWRVLCQAADVPADYGLRVDLEGQAPLAVFRLGDDFQVTADTCTHGDASLCEGFVENGQVECPWHAGRFDIRSGEALCFPAQEAIRVYPTRTVDGVVQALIPTSE